MQSHDLHTIFITSICAAADYLSYGKAAQTQSVIGNCQPCEHQQDLQMLKLAPGTMRDIRARHIVQRLSCFLEMMRSEGSVYLHISL